MKNLFLLLSLSLIVVLPACQKESDDVPIEDCENVDVTYNAVIVDIFSGCQGSNCHGAGTGREMIDYETSVAFAMQGRIIGALNRDAGFSAMPRNGAMLEQCEIDQVQTWINEGFPES